MRITMLVIVCRPELIDIVKIPFGLLSREYNNNINNIISHAFRSFFLFILL